MLIRMGVLKVACLSAALSVAAAAQAVTYDLAQDWSDNSNPNGPWSYREGTTVLPHTASWTAGVNFPVIQPAYQPANLAGSFLPSWFKATSVPTGFDIFVGDVVVHTNDSSNGNESLGVANVLFTAPAAGTYDISGGLWNANTSLVCCDFARRPQDWRLIVDGSIVSSGTLSAVPGQFTRASQQTFDLLSVPLAAGGTVELDVFRDPSAAGGFFVGTDLTIQSAVPEPSSLALLAMGAVMLAFRARERKGHAIRS